MTKVTIYDRDGWRLTSYGRGWAYELEDTQSGKSVWFQDDAASDFANYVMDENGWLFDHCAALFADYSEVLQ